MISRGHKSSEPYEKIEVSDFDLASYYLNIKSIPCLIHSPLREDKKPSFTLYTKDNTTIWYKDFSTDEGGSLITLLKKLWHCTNYSEVYKKIRDDFIPTQIISNKGSYLPRMCKYDPLLDLKCKIRKWEDYDIEYWNSYGISLKWLKYAEVYPISHKLVIKKTGIYAYKAEKYAYAYVEHKEGNTTIKIYQPKSKKFKWSNKHDKSVISLWTKIPEKGERLCICSSLKDALCLWVNTKIPAIAIQGEGYSISKTAITDLKKRYNKIYILLDNDAPGLKDGIKLAKKTGFINLVLPQFKGGKDISDYFKIKGKTEFKKTILNLFKNN